MSRSLRFPIFPERPNSSQGPRSPHGSSPRLGLAGLALALGLASAACESDDKDTASGSETGETAETGDSDLLCSEPDVPACLDDLISDLSLHDDKVAEGSVTTTTEGDDFVTVVDASQGGSTGAVDYAWVYVRFTADGAEKLEIDDETAAEEDMDWHIAMRRYYVRINSGDAGPSCVTAAQLAGYEYDEVDSLPSGVSFEEESFYTEDCEVIPDNHGLGDPAFVLNEWWDYASCVQTTLIPYVLQLEDGSHVLLVVEAYYTDGQDLCNQTGQMGSGTGGGNLKVRWRFLD